MTPTPDATLDPPLHVTVAGHLYVHVAACPCHPAPAVCACGHIADNHAHSLSPNSGPCYMCDCTAYEERAR